MDTESVKAHGEAAALEALKRELTIAKALLDGLPATSRAQAKAMRGHRSTAVAIETLYAAWMEACDNACDPA